MFSNSNIRGNRKINITGGGIMNQKLEIIKDKNSLIPKPKDKLPIKLIKRDIGNK